MPDLTRDAHKALNNLSREKIVTILESYGFACYDSESTYELREALKVSIKNGTIDIAVLSDDA